MAKKPLRIAVLVSGNGSNLQVLMDKQLSQTLNIHIVGVISNKQNAYALIRAQNANIPTFVIDKDEHQKTYPRAEFERRALAVLDTLAVDLVVLAGFMKILTPLFIDGVQARNLAMINLHPSILPDYKGLDTHTRVLRAGEIQHGCSVHLVTQELDAGQTIAQAITPILPNESADTLQKRIHALEHQLLPMVVHWFAEGQIVIDNKTLTHNLGAPLPLRLYYS